METAVAADPQQRAVGRLAGVGARGPGEDFHCGNAPSLSVEGEKVGSLHLQANSVVSYSVICHSSRTLSCQRKKNKVSKVK